MSNKQHKRLRKVLREQYNIDPRQPAVYKARETEKDFMAIVPTLDKDGKQMTQIVKNKYGIETVQPQFEIGTRKRIQIFNETKWGYRAIKRAIKNTKLSGLQIEKKEK